jgi:hypothetical protein
MRSKNSDESNSIIFNAKIKNAKDKINTFGFLEILYESSVIMNKSRTIPIMLISK